MYYMQLPTGHLHRCGSASIWHHRPISTIQVAVSRDFGQYVVDLLQPVCFAKFN